VRPHEAKTARLTKSPAIRARLKPQKRQRFEIPALVNDELGCDIESFNRIAEHATLGWLVQTGWLSGDASRRNRFH